MYLFPWITFVLLSLNSTCHQNDDLIPAELNGVWTIVAVREDGVQQPLAKDPDGSVSIGEWNETEMIIYANRIVIVKTGGASMVGKVKVLATEPEVKIQVNVGYCHDKEGVPGYAILKRSGDGLELAWGPPEMRTIDAKKGGGQIVVSAKRDGK